jgi:hypothetical protein|tara:strand:- start:927 stop:1343 length:417 start_codon:yes stop_codon:yes gene_type:complete
MIAIWDKLPAWVRWILFFPVSVFLGLIAGMILITVSLLTAIEPFFVEAVHAAAVSLFVIYFVFLLAPKFNLKLAIATAALRNSCLLLMLIAPAMIYIRGGTPDFTWDLYCKPLLVELWVLFLNVALIMKIAKKGLASS